MTLSDLERPNGRYFTELGSSGANYVTVISHEYTHSQLSATEM